MIKRRPAESAREAALQVVYRVMEEGAFASLALNEILQDARINTQDKSLATELAYSTIKAWQTLDWVLGLFIKKPLNKMPPWIRCLLRLGAAQLLFIDRIPAWAAINETVELAKKYGHRGTVSLVNGVLRNLDRKKEKIPYPDAASDPAGYLALRYYHPLWLVTRWLNEFGYRETESLCRINNEPAPLIVRANTLKTGIDELIKRLREEGAVSKRCRFSPEGLIVEDLGSVEASPSFQEGLFYVQDEASQLVSHALKPLPGAKVIDVSAAPGGKTTHLAQLMENRGLILAGDIHPGRLEMIKENCRRLGIECVETVQIDAREWGSRYPEVAEYLLIDAPCSGLGVLRRRPDARWRKELNQIGEMSQLQLEILMGASKALKPGGILVYSTCSIAREENQEVIRKFLEQDPYFKMVSLEHINTLLPADLKEDTRKGWLQFLPQRHGTDGFFIARLKKA